MAEEDIFCRFILYPKAFPSGSKILDPGALFKLIELESDKVWALSLTEKKDTPALDIHRHGCLAAAKSDAAFASRMQRQPERETETTHYIGYYELAKWAVSHQKLEHLNVALYPLPEDGNDGHYNCVLFPKTSSPGSIKRRKSDMRVFRDFLSDCMGGPERHICEEDEDIADHLMAIEAPIKPKMTLAALKALRAA